MTANTRVVITIKLSLIGLAHNHNQPMDHNSKLILYLLIQASSKNGILSRLKEKKPLKLSRKTPRTKEKELKVHLPKVVLREVPLLSKKLQITVQGKFNSLKTLQMRAQQSNSQKIWRGTLKTI